MRECGQHVASESGSAEATLTEEDQWMVTLKNGATVDGRIAVATWEVLRSRFERDSSSMSALYDLVVCDKPIPPAVMQELGSTCFVRGELRPLVRQLILNGVKSDGETTQLTLPFDRSSENEVKLNQIASIRNHNADLLVSRLKSNHDSSQSESRQR